ncbi:MAG: hypothetical protein ACF8XB_20030 [Planctomycetota bacterium JB042]
MSGPLLLLLTLLLPPETASGRLEVAPPTEAPIARLTRHTDPVAKLDGLARSEVRLFHWDKVASLRRGDGLRQGPHGQSEVFFLSDRSLIKCSGETWLTVGLDAQGRRTVEANELRRLHLDLRTEPLTLRLPGGAELEARETTFRVTLDPLDRRHVVRNAGPGDVVVRGPVTPLGEGAVRPGHEVEIPIVREAVVEAPPADADWEGVPLRLDAEVRAEPTADGVRIEGTGTARLRGARIHVSPGHAIHVRRPRRPTN